MRQYHAVGQTVDLDNPEIYDHLPDNIAMLDAKIFQEIGIFYWYTTYEYPEWDQNQKDRAHLLIQRFTSGRKTGTLLWYKEMLFLFQDELENLC